MHRLGDQLLADPGLPKISTFSSELATTSISWRSRAMAGSGLSSPAARGRAGCRGTRGSLLWRASRSSSRALSRAAAARGPHQPQLLVADAVELGRVHAVYGQGADQRLIREERQADAGVHLEVVVIRQQAVIGSGRALSAGKRTTSPARAMASRRG